MITNLILLVFKRWWAVIRLQIWTMLIIVNIVFFQFLILHIDSIFQTIFIAGEFSSGKFKNSLRKLMNPTNQQKNAKRGMSSLITLKTLKTKESASRWKWSLKWTSLLTTNQRQSWSIISMSAKWRSTITLSTWKYCSLRLLSSALMLKILALSSHSYLRRLHLIQTRQPLSSLFHQTSLQEI